MIFRQLFDQKSSTYTYLLADKQTHEAILIDPVADKVERDITLINDLGLRLLYSIETHVHADHITASGQLKQRLGCKTAVSARGGVGCADVQLKDGDTIQFGKEALEVRATPGHTNSCMSYVTSDQKMVFTGDSLLIRGTGRTDFQQGSSRSLFRLVHDKIFSLPDDTLVYPGHDYQGRTVTSVREEKALNPRLGQGISEDAYVEIMKNLDLDLPKQIHKALPANLHCGINPNAAVDEAPTAPTLWAPIHRTATGIPELPIKWVVNHGDEARKIDVRGLDEFRGSLGHLTDAELVPLDTLANASEAWDRDENIVLICRSGGRSGQAALLLENLGFKHIASMTGGMLAVAENGYSVILGTLSTLPAVRDEIFACFVGMNEGGPEVLAPMYQGIFQQLGLDYNQPTVNGLDQVLSALRAGAIHAGKTADEVDPHLNQFREALHSATFSDCDMN